MIVENYHGINIIKSPTGRTYDLHGLKYHSSWDWLMDIVTEINNTKNVGEFLGFEVVIAKDNTSITCFYKYAGVHSIVIGRTSSEKHWISIEGNDIKENTYKAVIEFINWYNEQLKSNS